ncbi:glycosyltransferase family 2 protein [Erwinia amylovora]|uniref:Amylovoran biosynthesis glycosyltransferase AmsE n=5 Tax=Erwinia amylovora TaxID=552 RepID=AMSE_ERWAM|nr:glycosyltransferase [Erwinia amylovora]Q46635.2 RecName: Full=Amylovoran biosynthesis glycosyltransferase AmsE [Erwinia amylovora]CBX81125.1 putative glycosyltransferase [Erwinia amylovora ATCC BAA-2158]CDK15670.1 putative glycosyltransferase [Erwinia amylovora LA635]CDK19036.1 putative glycosyltransferase [Erwinia amylovora LA636]CDK22407.1 putative glycosyltransferase [Erwinia amylovora LA637]ATZ11960.1 amylovoran biosynthesis glycosyltransferase AmsE [Erwinia amylovora]
MFSVLISLYNKEKPENLEQCLESLHQQTLNADEIVLVYDGPVSESLKAVATRWANLLPLVIVPLEKNLGLGKALNAGLERCTHNVVARMDTDDICLPERFEKQISYMESHPEVVLSGAAVIEFDEHGKERLKRLPLSNNDIHQFARMKNPFNHMCVVFRKDKVISAGSYQHHLYMEDYNLWLRIMSLGHPVANLPDVLMKVRAGSDMVNKRRGWNYIKSEVQLYRLKLALKQTGFIRGTLYFLIRTMTRLMPVKVMQFLYEKDRKG